MPTAGNRRQLKVDYMLYSYCNSTNTTLLLILLTLQEIDAAVAALKQLKADLEAQVRILLRHTHRALIELLHRALIEP